MGSRSGKDAVGSASCREGPFDIQRRIASALASGDDENGTTASENPLRYLRVEYSQTAEYPASKIARIRRMFPAYQTDRKSLFFGLHNSISESSPAAVIGGGELR